MFVYSNFAFFILTYFMLIYSIHSLMLILMQFYLHNLIFSLVLFFNIKPIYYCIQLNCYDSAYHLFIPMHDFSFISYICKVDDKVKL